jgi:hypothetical protein
MKLKEEFIKVKKMIIKNLIVEYHIRTIKR